MSYKEFPTYKSDISTCLVSQPTCPLSLTKISQVSLVFQMAIPFNIEQANPEARRAERDRQRRMVFPLPRTTGVESFLANLGALHLDGQDRVQDALLHLVDENVKDGYGIRTFLNSKSYSRIRTLPLTLGQIVKSYLKLHTCYYHTVHKVYFQNYFCAHSAKSFAHSKVKQTYIIIFYCQLCSQA
jgi:hypothetical protein